MNEQEIIEMTANIHHLLRVNIEREKAIEVIKTVSESEYWMDYLITEYVLIEYIFYISK